MNTKLIVLLITALILIVGLTLIADAEPNNAYVDVAPTNSGDVDITNLTFYDRDSNGILSKQEIEVVITDGYYMQLTDPQIATLTEIMGYYPWVRNIPAPKKPVVVIPTPEPNYPCDYENIVDVKYGVYNPGHGDDVQYRANWRSVRYNCDDVIGIMTNPRLRLIIFLGDRNTCWYRDTATPEIDDQGEDNQALPYSPCDTPQ